MPLGAWELFVLIAWPAACGFACALWERYFLAPRRLSAAVPMFLTGASAVVLLIVLGNSVIDIATLGGTFFVVGLLPSWLGFIVSRRLLRTRFADEQDT